jgi:hypothetical protein
MNPFLFGLSTLPALCLSDIPPPSPPNPSETLPDRKRDFVGVFSFVGGVKEFLLRDVIWESLDCMRWMATPPSSMSNPKPRLC